MNQDSDRLRLLAIFHYIVAGLAALFSFFPLLYAAMGAFFIWAAQHPNPKQTGEPPPEFLGWIFIAGAMRKRYMFAFVVACIECIFMPFGTVLGVFTIIALSRESVKALFSTAPV